MEVNESFLMDRRRAEGQQRRAGSSWDEGSCNGSSIMHHRDWAGSSEPFLMNQIGAQWKAGPVARTRRSFTSVMNQV